LQNPLAQSRLPSTPSPESVGSVSDPRVKAKIIITPKPSIPDPQGKAIHQALERMGYSGILDVHVGKYIEIDLAPGHDRESVREALADASRRLLSNTVVEEHRIEMTD